MVEKTMILFIDCVNKRSIIESLTYYHSILGK